MAAVQVTFVREIRREEKKKFVVYIQFDLSEGGKKEKKQVSWIVPLVHGVTYNPVVCFASVNRFREGKQQQQQ